MTLSTIYNPGISTIDNYSHSGICLEHPKSRVVSITMAVAGSIFTVAGGISLVAGYILQRDDDSQPSGNIAYLAGATTLAAGSICIFTALGISYIHAKFKTPPALNLPENV